MSDYSISIVPKQSNYPDAEKKAAEILDFLISRDIVKGLLTDCALSQNGYSISEGARLVTDDPQHLPFGLWTNGLAITTTRQVFDAGENGINVIICPDCGQDIVAENWDLNEWYSGSTDNLTCPLCNTGSEINTFRFEPEWGFSNLGFTFWNWPSLTESFIEEFKRMLGTEVVVVYQHL